MTQEQGAKDAINIPLGNWAEIEIRTKLHNDDVSCDKKTGGVELGRCFLFEVQRTPSFLQAVEGGGGCHETQRTGVGALFAQSQKTLTS